MAYVTFIHGMANKPPYEPLKASWCNALSTSDPARGSAAPVGNPGLDLSLTGIGFDMTYWADVLYAVPEAVKEGVEEMFAALESVIEGRPLGKGKRGAAPKWRGQLKSKAEKDFVAAVEKEVKGRLDGYLAVNSKTKRRTKLTKEAQRNELRLPEFIQKPILEEFLRDVHHYFYSVDYPTKIRRAWINVYDKYDPVVGFDPKFANDYKRDGKVAVKDINEQNWGKWRHNIVKYLSGPLLRAQMREALK